MKKLYAASKVLLYSFHKNIKPSPIAKRTLPYIDLTYLIDGSLEYYCNGEHVIMKPGDAIIFPVGSERERILQSTSATYASFNVVPPEDFEIEIAGRVQNAVNKNTVFMLEQVEGDFGQVTANRKEKCLSVFYYLYYQLLETAQSTDNPHIKMIKQFIFDHISEPIGLERIAEHVHLVPRYVCSLFKKSSGMTLTEYICRERISLAKKMIVTSDLALSQIYALCGFTDYNYFSRTFKKIVGVTAASYKKTKLKGI